MNASCKNPKCLLAETKHCYLNHDPVHDCPDYVKENEEKKVRVKKTAGSGTMTLWSGEYFRPEDIGKISKRSTPGIIGIVGTAGAGKTSYLGMVYTLMLNGRFITDYRFAGSFTLTAWEQLAYGLRFHKGKVIYPEATPSNPDFYSIYHLSLATKNTSKRELFLADASGEVFSEWSKNKHHENAGSARWIHSNANGFVLFIDCAALVKDRAEAKENILDIAQQLKQDLNGRPVAIVWSKADEIENVRKNIRDSLQEELKQLFPGNTEEFQISNHTLDDPDPNCHENNPKVLNWLMNQMHRPTSNEILLMPEQGSKDLFLNYRRTR